MTSTSSPVTSVDPTHCPRCSTGTVTIREAVPWCPTCEWNLDRYEPNRRRPEFGWRWVDRLTHRLAYRLTRQQFTDLAARSLDRPPLSLAGSTAATSLTGALLTMEAIEMVVRREARAGHGAAHWRAAADEARTSAATRLPLLRQLSIRDEVSMFATHPPAGLRARMTEARPWRTPAVTLTEAGHEQIDNELTKEYARIRRDLGWSN